MLASSCWTMTPICSQRKPWDSNPQTAKPSPVFKTGSSTIRMASRKVPGVGIEPTNSWFRARRHYQQQLPRIVLFETRVVLQSKFGEEGVEPPSSGSRPESLPLADPRSRSRVPCGNRTRLASLEDWNLCRSAKGTSKRKERESNPQGCEARPGSSRGAIASWLALPFSGSGRRDRTSIPCLTGRSITVIGYRIKKVRTAGVEPAISCARSTRNTRLSYVLL